QEIVRVRVFGLKNRGKVTLALRGYMIPGSESMPGFIEKILKIGGEVSFNFTKNIFNVKDLPIDTMMVDYLYKFKKDLRPDQISTEAALDELLKNIKGFGFTPLFNVLASQDELAQTLKSRAALSERLAREDYNLGDKAR